MDSVAVRRIGAQFEGILIQQMLAPLAQSFGEVGQFVLTPVAESIAERDANGFGRLVSAALERENAAQR